MERLPEKLANILEQFDAITDPEERTMLLLDFAGRFKPVPADIAVAPYPASHRVAYCESEAYVWVLGQKDGTVRLHFAVENPSGLSAKCLCVVLERTLSGCSPEEVAGIPEDIVYRIFRQNLSMGKGMGLLSIVRHVTDAARRLIAREPHPSHP